MDKQLKFMLTQAQVLQLQARYTDAVWRKDINAFADCFTEDAQWRTGGKVMTGRGEIVAQMTKIFALFQRILMTMRTPHVVAVPGGATTRTYVTENNIYADGTPVTAIGTCFDRLRDEEGGWRFSWRLFQTAYLGPADLSGAFFEGNPDFGSAPHMPPLDAATIDFTGMHTGVDRK